MKWYFQLVHHPIWDYDMSSPPLLVDITVDGKPIKAVAVPTKQACLYVFDRVTGKPIWPIVEKPVPQSDVPGEKTSKTQPFPTKPAPYARQASPPDDLIDFTPELHAEAVDLIKKYYKMGPMFTPAVVSKTGGFPSALYGAARCGRRHQLAGRRLRSGNPDRLRAGGNDAALDCSGPGAAAGRLVRRPDIWKASAARRSASAAVPASARPRTRPRSAPKTRSWPRSLAAHPQHRRSGRRRRATWTACRLVKPPYGTLTAINLDTGDFLWQVPHGDTPDEIRNNPALKGINIPKTGQTGNVGAVVTKTLVIVGDPQISTQPGHPRGAYAARL